MKPELATNRALLFHKEIRELRKQYDDIKNNDSIAPFIKNAALGKLDSEIFDLKIIFVKEKSDMRRWKMLKEMWGKSKKDLVM